MDEIRNADFFGLKVSIFSEDQLRGHIENCIIKRKQTVLYGYAFGTVPYFKKYPELYKHIESFDIMVTDGRWFYLLCKLNKIPLKIDISVPQLVKFILDIANKNGNSILLFGAKREINTEASQNIIKTYRNIKVYDGIDGYYKKDEESAIIERINKANPDILLIGISVPIKEKFVYTYRSNLKCSVIVPCGGVLDILAGHKFQTPPLIKKLGLASVIRTIQEPYRMIPIKLFQFYELFLRVFPSIICAKLLGKKFFIPSLYDIKEISSISDNG